MILYAIKDLTADRMYFNARGGAYKNEDKASAKLKSLKVVSIRQLSRIIGINRKIIERTMKK